MQNSIDWSIAPKDATHWIMTEYGAVWAAEYKTEVTCSHSNHKEYAASLSACDNDNNPAPSFGIKFDLKDIIIKRPPNND